MMSKELIAIEQISRGVWQANGQVISWGHFPQRGITGYDHRNNQVLITPEWWPRPNKELVGVTITGLSYAYQDCNQQKFWLSKHQFATYFLGVPGAPRVLQIKDRDVDARLEQEMLQPLNLLCE